MSLDHDVLVGFSKSFGLFYLLALSAAVLVYTFWPSNKPRFDHAAQSILSDEDKPFGDQSLEDRSWR
jgi:cytochrome c oxidase cbb3-type subunit IV